MDYCQSTKAEFFTPKVDVPGITKLPNFHLSDFSSWEELAKCLSTLLPSCRITSTCQGAQLIFRLYIYIIMTQQYQQNLKFLGGSPIQVNLPNFELKTWLKPLLCSPTLTSTLDPQENFVLIRLLILQNIPHTKICVYNVKRGIPTSNLHII
jgi:hypothetical protein